MVYRKTKIAVVLSQAEAQVGASRMNLRCKKIGIVVLYSWFTLWEGRLPPTSFCLPQKETYICSGISNTNDTILFSHSHITQGNMTEFGGVFPGLGNGEKWADPLCSQSEPVLLMLDLVLRQAWIWPCLFLSLEKSLNCFPTISSKLWSQHGANHKSIPGLWVSSTNKTVIFAAFLFAAKTPVCRWKPYWSVGYRNGPELGQVYSWLFSLF